MQPKVIRRARSIVTSNPKSQDGTPNTSTWNGPYWEYTRS